MRTIRKMVTPTIWIMVAGLILWSIQGVFTGLSQNARGVGRAFGKIVTFKEYDDAFKSTQLLTNRGNDQVPSMDELREATWQHIILNRESLREKIQIADAQVISEISKLLGGEVLSPQAYNQLVRKNFNEHPRNFEERIRTILRIRKLYEQHQNIEATTTADEVDQFFINDQSKISVDYIQFKSESEAKEFRTKIADMNAWNEEKNKTEKRIGSLGPVNIDIFMTVLGIEQKNVNTLLELGADQLSETIPTKTGYAIFNVVQKELTSKDSLDDIKREDYRNRLLQQKKQSAFADWWNDVMKRANVEKFQTAVNAN